MELLDKLLRRQPEIDEAIDMLDKIDRRAEEDAKLRKEVSATLAGLRLEMDAIAKTARRQR